MEFVTRETMLGLSEKLKILIDNKKHEQVFCTNWSKFILKSQTNSLQMATLTSLNQAAP